MGKTHAKHKRKLKNKIKPSTGQTYVVQYYLQLINCKQRGLNPHKTQKKIQKNKIKSSEGQTRASQYYL